MTLIGDLARAVVDCLCMGLEQAGRPVCRCALYHGEMPPPADDCACTCADGGQGQAWVRAAGAQARSGVPEMGCGVVLSRLVLEAGVYRCVAVPDRDGVPPSGDAQTADALDAWQDAEVLMGLAGCCPLLAESGARLVEWRPMGPAGGCAGSAVLIAVDL